MVQIETRSRIFHFKRPPAALLNPINFADQYYFSHTPAGSVTSASL